MSKTIVLKNNPKMEFQLLDNGFKFIDCQTEGNTGFYSYHDIQSIELNKVWHPRLVRWLRYGTWLLNGAPMVACESSKKANLVINSSQTKLKIWLSDSDMADKAIRLMDLLNRHTKHIMV